MLVNFGFDSTKVEEKYFNELGELADFLKRFEDVYVDIEGNMDSTGPEEYNQGLSERRAQAVADYLKNKSKVQDTDIEVIGRGESDPIASNDTREGRALNRRVSIRFEGVINK